VLPWTAPVNAKGKLQQAWFRVKGIPTDQRSIRTVAKAAGLVGKAVVVDEKTRLKNEVVRVKIACRYVVQVPAVAEGSLGMWLYDFFFEREVVDEMQGKKDKEGT
jgi:hypothetical protein